MKYKNRIIKTFLPLIFLPLLGGMNDNAKDESKKIFTFADIVKKEGSAVVNISTTRQENGNERGSGFHFFRDFFGDNRPKDFNGRSLGSGFFIRMNGVILTNYHVIEGFDRIIVRFSDGREFDAGLIGFDRKTDIALINVKNIKKNDLFPTVRLGDSDKLEIGEWVIAIGNPFGLEQTVTVGIVSGKGRFVGTGPYDDFIQTDASINPGNSGGPLFNIRGEVVGVNSMINSAGQGIGFAIPINLVKKIAAQLEKDGKVTRGWLGVIIQEVTKEVRSNLGLRHEEGAMISEVIEESPASRSGLKKGDIITEFDGKRIKRVGDLPMIVSETPVDKVVFVKTLREGKEKQISVKIGRLEDETGQKAEGRGR